MSCTRSVARAALGCVAYLLSACSSSPPTHYYLLSQVMPASAASLTAAADAVVIRVQPVSIPPELDRLQLVTHLGANDVRIADTMLWAAPLDEQLRRILSADLAARLPPLLVADPNEPSTKEPRRLLSLAIDEFYADESCSVTLHANWTLRDPAAPVRRGVETLQLPASVPCADEAGAMSRALGMLADRLAPALSNP